MIEIEAPDGSVIEFPDGTTDDVITRVMKQSFAPKEQPGFFETAKTAVKDEVARSFNESVASARDLLLPKEYGGQREPDKAGSLQNILKTGQGVLAAASIPFSPFQGVARAAIGHPMAAAERAVGGLINPEAAAKRTPEAAYEDWRGATDTALSALSPRSASPAGAVVKPPAIPTAAELKATAKAAYQSPEVASLKINPASTDALASKIESDLLSQGFRPTPASAPSALANVRELKPAAGVTEVSVADIDSARRALGKTAKQRDAFGQATPDAAAASMAIRQIDDYLGGLTARDVLAGDAAAAQRTLTDARGNYAAGKRASEIDFRLDKADRQAARSGSGMNIENARRQKIDQVSDYGLRPDEIALRDKIVLGDKPRNALRTLGKAGVDGGLSLMLNMAGAVATGGLSLPITAAGTGARMLGQQLTKSQIKKLNEMIRSRSPLAKSRAPVPIPAPSGLLGALYPELLGEGLGGLLSPMPVLNER
jgi:hypothetical protein